MSSLSGVPGLGKRSAVEGWARAEQSAAGWLLESSCYSRDSFPKGFAPLRSRRELLSIKGGEGRKEEFTATISFLIYNLNVGLSVSFLCGEDYAFTHTSVRAPQPI